MCDLDHTEAVGQHPAYITLPSCTLIWPRFMILFNDEFCRENDIERIRLQNVWWESALDGHIWTEWTTPCVSKAAAAANKKTFIFSRCCIALLCFIYCSQNRWIYNSWLQRNFRSPQFNADGWHDLAIFFFFLFLQYKYILWLSFICNPNEIIEIQTVKSHGSN